MLYVRLSGNCLFCKKQITLERLSSYLGRKLSPPSNFEIYFQVRLGWLKQWMRQRNKVFLLCQIWMQLKSAVKMLLESSCTSWSVLDNKHAIIKHNWDILNVCSWVPFFFSSLILWKVRRGSIGVKILLGFYYASQSRRVSVTCSSPSERLRCSPPPLAVLPAWRHLPIYQQAVQSRSQLLASLLSYPLQRQGSREHLPDAAGEGDFDQSSSIW